MAEDKIVSTEMPIADMEKLLAGVTDKAEGTEKGVEKKASPAPVVKAESVVDKEPESIEDAEAVIKGLRAELGRRKGNAAQVEQLENELSYMKGQLDTLVKTKGTTDELADTVSKMDDTILLERKDQWAEEIASLRGKFDRAEESGDQEAMQKLGGQIANARRISKAIQTEEKARVDARRTQTETQLSEGKQVASELDVMFNLVLEQHPEFDDQESALWQAGQEEFNKYPVVMQKLGPAAQIVAAALAAINHPELVSQKADTDVRKEVLKNIDKGLNAALSVGTKGNPGKAPSASTIVVDTADGLAAFNRMVDKVKGN